MSVFWKSKVELSGTSFGDKPHVAQANRVWTDVRFDIERGMGIHTIKQKKASREEAFIVGYRFDDYKDSGKSAREILDHELIVPGDRIVVARKPMPANMKPFAPYSASVARPTRELTEDEKIQQVATISALGTGMHASSYIRNMHLIKCKACGEAGHIPRTCPKMISDPSFVPLNRRRPPTGIPKSMLREAKTEDEIRSAWITAEGKYVVKK